MLLARTNSFQVVPSVDTSTLYVESPDVIAGAVQVSASDVLLPEIFEATAFVTVGLPVVTAAVVAWPAISKVALKLGVIRNRYEVPKVSPVTDAEVVVDAVRSKVVQVLPSVDTSMR